jgi:transcriptional regulator with XRE-family HTH domain
MDRIEKTDKFQECRKNTLNKLIGNNVRHLRLEKKLTQEELSTIADINVKYCSEIERGNTNLSVNILCKLSHALEVTTGELMSSAKGKLPRIKTGTCKNS